MTGFGGSQYSFNNKVFNLEIKSLNSKGIDVNVRVPSAYRSKDIEIRKHIIQMVGRGKVDFSLQVESLEGNKQYSINKEVVQAYMEELKGVHPQISETEALTLAMRLPEVLNNQDEEISDEEWKAFLDGFQQAYQKFYEFRKEEGSSLENEFRSQISFIEKLLGETEPYLSEREHKMKDKLFQSISEWKIDYDEDRFQQELIYYLEKLDVSEEKVRLQQHLDYFIQTLDSKEDAKGKTLNFIAQEIGREINTLGSKANHSELQKIVVQMKDSLEKIKEQTFNVL